jgi:hypothetical protein
LLSPCSLPQIDLVTGKEEVRLPNVGVKAHGLVHWGSGMLVLDSNGGALSMVDPTAGAVTQLWHVSDLNLGRDRVWVAVVLS